MDDTTGQVMLWWRLLCGAAVVNLVAWAVSAWWLRTRVAALPKAVAANRRILLWLSAAYVLGCGFRSVFPMVDVARMCLHGTWISRIFVGRSVATVAEVCFAAQWAILLGEAAASTGSRFVGLAAQAVIPLIVMAEVFSWSAILTTDNLLHAVENSLWTLVVILAVSAFLSVRSRLEPRARRVVAAVALVGLAYVAFMVACDVPLYIRRWHADIIAGHTYLWPGEGLATALRRCVVVRDWSRWRDDASWLTLYFTVAVWFSVGLVHVPPLRGSGTRD
ncbi:MAG: hypothetical protein GC151_13665 [Betaproteobacteria bacterium]|nr:hypothetical protein [Betaproteobacteria bacterium]